ncbi:MAG: NifB/NifX family molybdenum-iron cluster-binding protein [Bacteroidales bacterium]
MKIAFTSTGKDWDALIDPRFGRAKYLVLYDEENDLLTVLDNHEADEMGHGAGTATTQKLAEINPDLLITGNGPGENASNALKHLNIKILTGAHDLSLRQAYEKFQFGQLGES